MSMSQAQATAPQPNRQENQSEKDQQPVAPPELTLEETLRVLEMARGMSRKRSDAQVALARDDIKEMLRKRLMEAAAVTGDKVRETDVDAAIENYFQRLHAYEDPPFSMKVLFANLYVRRRQIALFCSAVAALVASGAAFLFFS